MPDPLVVFAYAFPHRKTQDFLLEIAASGYRKVCVIAAPWAALKGDTTKYFTPALRHAPPRAARDICSAFGFTYCEATHGDLGAISANVEMIGARVGIIAGARILRQAVIDLFPVGIINFHPGMLPETAGLDSFYYSIQKDVPVGTTAHFIDSRVDAGRQLFFAETSIGAHDTPEIVMHNSYQTQIEALRRVLDLLESGNLNTTDITRPRANTPMLPSEKQLALSRFEAWREARAQEVRLVRTG